MNEYEKYLGLDFEVVEHDENHPMGSAVLSGLGENEGTWDSNHDYTEAVRLAKELANENPKLRYTVEEVLFDNVVWDSEKEDDENA